MIADHDAVDVVSVEGIKLLLLSHWKPIKGPWKKIKAGRRGGEGERGSALEEQARWMKQPIGDGGYNHHAM